MRAKIGDVVIDRTYNKKGNLAIVVGEGISQPILIYHKGGITMDKLRDYFATWDGLEVIGHIDFEKVWEEAVRTADRKTEPTQSQHVQHVESVGEDRKTEQTERELEQARDALKRMAVEKMTALADRLEQTERSKE